MQSHGFNYHAAGEDMSDLYHAGETQLMGYGESDSSGAWLKFQVMPEDLEKFRGLKGQCFAIGLQMVEHVSHETPKQKGEFGEEAKQLRQSGFFRIPDVWKACGTDAEFLAWLRTQPCCIKDDTDPHSGDVCACHVRRVANGSGASIKPEYSAVPMCHYHHALQHSAGESALGGREFFDRERIRHLERWAWEQCKKAVFAESMSNVPPLILRSWAEEHDLYKYLPSAYQ